MPPMLPRNVFPKIGRCLSAATPGAGFAAGTTARYGDIIKASESGQLGRYLNLVILGEGTQAHTSSGPSAALTTLTINIQGCTVAEATTGDTWANLTQNGTTDVLAFPASAMAGSTADLNLYGAVFGSIDLERSAYRSHRLCVAAVTGSTAFISAGFWISHQRRLVPDDVPSDQLIDLQHLASA